MEVISPNDNSYEVNQKTEEYLTNGVRLVWEVYPNTKTVNIFRADGSVTKLHEADQITCEAVLPSFACTVSRFFGG